MGVRRTGRGAGLLDRGGMLADRGRMLAQVLAVAPFTLRDLLSVDRDVARRFDADADLRSVHRHDGYLNVVTDA